MSDAPDEEQPAATVPGVDHDAQRSRAVEAARAADAKGAMDVVVLDVADITTMADFFVVASGRTDRQVGAIVDGVREQLRTLDAPSPGVVEGASEREWVLLNYAGLLVHVFSEEMRSYYSLERLWQDAPRVAWAPDLDVD